MTDIMTTASTSYDPVPLPGRAGEPTPAPAEPPNPILDAFQLELKRLIAEPITNKSLQQIEHLAKTARSVISPAFGKRRGFASIDYGGSSDDEGGGAMLNIGEPLAPAPPQETFGAKIIREVVGSLPTLLGVGKKEAPIGELTFALDHARKMKDADLEARLVRRLNALLDDPPALPPAPTDHPHPDHPPAAPALPASEGVSP